MEIFSHLSFGFSIAFTPGNLFYCFIGVFVGTLIGVLPGLGPVATISLLFPITFHMPPVGAIIMLAGIYYGAMYGGSTTSILVNIPGEAASVVTCLDGYQMARKGRAGPALGIAAFGSFIAGTFSILGLTLIAPPLAEIALKFGPPEFFSVMLASMAMVIYLTSGSIPKSIMMAVLGVILGTIGIDPTSGKQRFTFDLMELSDGIGLGPLIIGLFGVSEVLINVEEGIKREIFQTRLKGLFPSRRDWCVCAKPIIRGSFLGFLFGILPGAGPVISSFISYGLEKRLSDHPEEFGHGAIEGVAGPESANNAATGGAFVPLFTLGIPSNATMALLLGLLTIYGMQPGPLLLKNKPDLFWGVVTSMYLGNFLLLILNLPLIGLWVQVLKIPYKILFPLILLFCTIGVYSIESSIFDVFIMIMFGMMGYLMRKFGYEGAPLVLAFILGPMFEISLRQSLNISNGQFSIFFSRPISALAIAIALFMVLSPLFRRIRGKRNPVRKEI